MLNVKKITSSTGTKEWLSATQGEHIVAYSPNATGFKPAPETSFTKAENQVDFKAVGRPVKKRAVKKK